MIDNDGSCSSSDESVKRMKECDKNEPWSFPFLQSNESTEIKRNVDVSKSTVVNEQLSSIYDARIALINKVNEFSRINKPETKSKIENVQFNEESNEFLNNTESCIFEDEKFKAKLN